MELKTSSEYPHGAIEHEGHIIWKDGAGQTHIAEPANAIVESKDAPLVRVKASYSFEVDGEFAPERVGDIQEIMARAAQNQMAAPEGRTMVLPPLTPQIPHDTMRSAPAIEQWPAELMPGGVPDTQAPVNRPRTPDVRNRHEFSVDSLRRFKGLFGWSATFGAVAVVAAVFAGPAYQAGHDGRAEFAACSTQRIMGFVSPFCTAPRFFGQLTDPHNIGNFTPPTAEKK